MGDGTTSVVLFAGELLREVRGFIEEGVSPQLIIKGLRTASLLVSGVGGSGMIVWVGLRQSQGIVRHRRSRQQHVSRPLSNEIDCIEFGRLMFSEWRGLLEKCAATAMSSKLIHSHKEFFQKLVVDAVPSLDGDLDEKMIGMKTVAGGALQVFLPLLLWLFFVVFWSVG